MLKSKACHLKNLSPAQLIEKGEQETEWGGFFITGGHERLIRMLQTTRRNYPVSMQRPSWKNRGKNFSDLGISIGKLFLVLFTVLCCVNCHKENILKNSCIKQNPNMNFYFSKDVNSNTTGNYILASFL